MRGYSQAIIEANQAAKPSLGVMLGTLLIASKYSASMAAKELEVSRQTIYDWISGKKIPNRTKNEAIAKLIDKLANQ